MRGRNRGRDSRGDLYQTLMVKPEHGHRGLPLRRADCYGGEPTGLTERTSDTRKG